MVKRQDLKAGFVSHQSFDLNEEFQRSLTRREKVRAFSEIGPLIGIQHRRLFGPCRRRRCRAPGLYPGQCSSTAGGRRIRASDYPLAQEFSSLLG